MKLKRFFAVFLTLTLLTLPNFAQIHSFKSSKSNLGDTPSAPQYQIFDVGLVSKGDSASQGLGVSNGGIGLGRSLGSGSSAFTWTESGGIVGLPKLTGRTFCLSAGANDFSSVVGTCANSFFGTARLPVIWQNGVVSQLTLPAGQTIGDAGDVNASGVAVGSVNGGSAQELLFTAMELRR